jgi:hypothetical protein
MTPRGTLVATALGVQNMAKAYIVRRVTSDGGPMGDTYNYVKVTKPNPGETIYHGKFNPHTIDCGQYDADSMTVYYPAPGSEITSEPYEGDTEEF